MYYLSRVVLLIIIIHVRMTQLTIVILLIAMISVPALTQ